MIAFNLNDLLESLSKITYRLENKEFLSNIDEEDLTSERFSNIYIDSNKVTKGSIFIAIIGENNDGHDFLSDAVKNGAVLLIVSTFNKDINTPQIIVDNTRLAMGEITKYLSKNWNKPKIAITGSCGKTTTKFILDSILKVKGDVLCPEASFNNDLGVPLTMFNVQEQQWAGIFEMGTNHQGEIKYLADLIETDISMITSIAASHIGNFGTIENIAYEKSDIYSNLKSGGLAIYPYECEFKNIFKSKIDDINQKYNKNIKIMTFGFDKNADVYADNITIQPDCSKFTINYNNNKISVKLALLGEHQISNALAATVAGINLGLTFDDIKLGIENITAVDRRMQVYKISDNSVIIDDSYNANPLSVSSAINYLSKLNGYKILVFGDMAELGGVVIDEHKKIGYFAKQYNINEILAFGEYSKYTLQVFYGKLCNDFANKQELSNTLFKFINDCESKHMPCTVLVKGSNSMRMWEVTEKIKLMLSKSERV